MNKLLGDIYSDERSPGGFASRALLLKEAQKRDPNIAATDVRKFLHSNETYTKFYKPANVVQTNMILDYLDNRHYSDLAFFTNYKKYNKGYCYLLVVVDSFSRFIMVRALKTKECSEVASAYKDILLKTNRIPFRLVTDAGGEYLGRPMKNLYNIFRINHMVAKNTSIKAGFAENAIFRIKNKLFKYFSVNKTFNWTNAVNGIVEGLNSTYIDSIGTAPAFITFENASEVWKRLHKKYVSKPSIPPKFAINTIVRVSHGKQGFRKGTASRFTSELFKIKKIINYPIPVYILEDLKNGEEIDGIWYAEELVEFIKDSEVYPVDNIVKTRTRNGEKEFLVKFKGYKELYWIPARDLQNE